MTVDAIDIVEVRPRDGLQNKPEIIGFSDESELMKRAIAARARRIEVGSFVNAQRVPQMAGSGALAMLLPDEDQMVYSGLAMNMATSPAINKEMR